MALDGSNKPDYSDSNILKVLGICWRLQLIIITNVKPFCCGGGEGDGEGGGWRAGP